MNDKLFKPLNEQITVVNLKKEIISESEFNNTSNAIIFGNELEKLNESIACISLIKSLNITESDFNNTSNAIIFGNELEKLNESIACISLLEASIRDGRRFRKKLYKLKHRYKMTRDPLEKEKIFQQIEKLQRKMEVAGFKSSLNYAETTEGMPEDKKLAQSAEDYFGTTDPVLKAKAMKNYVERSDKLGSKGKPNTLSAMERELSDDY